MGVAVVAHGAGSGCAAGHGSGSAWRGQQRRDRAQRWWRMAWAVVVRKLAEAMARVWRGCVVDAVLCYMGVPHEIEKETEKQS